MENRNIKQMTSKPQTELSKGVEETNEEETEKSNDEDKD